MSALHHNGPDNFQAPVFTTPRRGKAPEESDFSMSDAIPRVFNKSLASDTEDFYEVNPECPSHADHPVRSLCRN